ncbi:hypothetical protein EAI_09502 [Harpegnathos saltator]|uniref:Uncharacterized protein n=1 Tax=Harpegnathos saltator TaxID=610380 RepID=E2B9I2_HARSA|nr:hypothetical protein EAI_09502 [Harpegnathos saltator]
MTNQEGGASPVAASSGMCLSPGWSTQPFAVAHRMHGVLALLMHRFGGAAKKNRLMKYLICSFQLHCGHCGTSAIKIKRKNTGQDGIQKASKPLVPKHEPYDLTTVASVQIEEEEETEGQSAATRLADDGNDKKQPIEKIDDIWDTCTSPETSRTTSGTSCTTFGTSSTTPGTSCTTPGTFSKTPGTSRMTSGTSSMTSETSATSSTTPGKFRTTSGTFARHLGHLPRRLGRLGRLLGRLNDIWDVLDDSWHDYTTSGTSKTTGASRTTSGTSRTTSGTFRMTWDICMTPGIFSTMSGTPWKTLGTYKTSSDTSCTTPETSRMKSGTSCTTLGTF